MERNAMWVAVEVTRFALPALAMRPRSALLDPTVRAAVLVDLALTGALLHPHDGLEVDTATTVFAPADRLLEAVVDKPDKPLGWWLYRAPITSHDVARLLIAEGDWDRHGPLRRYHDLHPDRTANQLRTLSRALRSRATPIQTSVGTLLNLVPLPGVAKLAPVPAHQF